MLHMARTREVFEASEDFTVGLEEEFQLLDPETLSLTQRFEELHDAGRSDPVLAESLAGELISSEIEIRSGRGESFADALQRQREARTRLSRLAEEHDVRLGATGAHPWSPWQQQRIIDTEHYRRLREELRYVARRNNTFSLHVHVGVRGADRAIAVCDRLRPLLPELLAISASSPFLDGEDSGLASARTQIFTKSFPRCGIPEPFGNFASYAAHVEWLERTRSISESTQLWWSVRPHHAFGTVEVRICDAQPSAAESTALAALIVACVAQTALEVDDGVPAEIHPGRVVEENFWRAIRYGLEGRMIDLDRGEEFPAAALPDRLLAWTAPARAELHLDPQLQAEASAARQRRAIDEGATIRDAFGAEVALTERTYATEEVTT
jgi:glutamate---cysteine ligase / carboxylate-amine ligase